MPKLVLVAVLFTLIGVACAPAATPAASYGPFTQTVEGIKVTVTLNPSPPVSSQSTTVEITLSDAQGQPINDARMVVSLESRGHAMAPNVGNAEPRGNGLYVGTMKPTGMGGDHSMNVNLQWQNKAYRAKFDSVIVR